MYIGRDGSQEDVATETRLLASRELTELEGFQRYRLVTGEETMARLLCIGPGRTRIMLPLREGETIVARGERFRYVREYQQLFAVIEGLQWQIGWSRGGAWVADPGSSNLSYLIRRVDVGVWPLVPGGVGFAGLRHNPRALEVPYLPDGDPGRRIELFHGDLLVNPFSIVMYHCHLHQWR